MLTKSFLVLITLLGIVYRDLPISVSLGDISIVGYIWQLGLICFGLCIVYVLLKHAIKKILRFFKWYKEYMNSLSPIQSIAIVANHALGIKLKNKIEFKESSIYVELIKFLIHHPVSKKVLEPYDHGNIIFSIQQIEKYMHTEAYSDASKLLEKMLREYGCIDWIYDRLHICYLKTKNYNSLSNLNLKANKNLNETKVLLLEANLSKINNLQERLLIYEQIYKLEPNKLRHLISYLKCLQHIGNFAAGIHLIKNSTCSDPEFIRLACDFFDTENYLISMNIISGMQDSVLKQVLLFRVSLQNRDIENAERAIAKLGSQNPVISNVLEIQLAREFGNTNQMLKTIDLLSKVCMGVS